MDVFLYTDYPPQHTGFPQEIHTTHTSLFTYSQSLLLLLFLSLYINN